MGGDLPQASEGKTAPVFMVGAMKDPGSGNLDRVQIVKGWVDEHCTLACSATRRVGCLSLARPVRFQSKELPFEQRPANDLH